MSMLRLYSPSGREDRVANLLATRMDKLGFENVHLDRTGNVLGQVGTGPPTILLCGHLDTVPGRLSVKTDGVRIWGRGAVDAKSSLAAHLEAASHFVQKPIDGRVIVAGVVEEEGRSTGVKELIESGLRADYAIFGEPSGADRITIGYKGHLLLRIVCKTPSVHASAPWTGCNSIERAYEIWKTIDNHPFEGEKGGDSYWSVSASITKISAGDATNVVPGVCEAFLDIRVPPTTTCDRVLSEIEKVITDYRSAFPTLGVGWEVEDKIDPFETAPRSLPVRALSLSILKVLGRRPTLMRKTGTGDMNILGRALRVPIVTYGPGDSKLSHTSEENIEIAEYLSSIKVVEQTIEEIVRLHKATV
jgi:LysW-gamma-L-lysine carboxypeptidase